ncbi:polymer-forming cytoskeletal protein [Aliifodinibius sp. S!AR15-10]|uniref:bactofilin family protein n=1 Tax=Aliifodinibius sp. S!AR15-10 TaxID=2950437 RepID=UPI0028603CA9|nr:polymer-forming cytoskeletal protein [Aliifodinibius sp. S!AR15-10]MDR8392731.1 polymer-forming cytoskeletal protein [Aliifodinibius sp. S!AR15-10]
MADGINGYVFLDASTDFKGEIEAERVVLEGKINGVVHANKGLHLKSGAHIEGVIHTGNFTAEKGASCRSELYINADKVDQESKKEADKDDSDVEYAQIPSRTPNRKISLF